MKNIDLIKKFSYVMLAIVLITLGLCFVNTAFIPSFMLMLSLYLFIYSYLMYLSSKRNIMYILFILGILLIIGSLVYTGMRIN